MRSTRAAAAWSGIALATSFLSVTIIGTQPHTTATHAIAERVAMTSTRVNALGPENSIEQADVAKRNTPSRAD